MVLGRRKHEKKNEVISDLGWSTWREPKLASIRRQMGVNLGHALVEVRVGSWG